MGKLILFLMAFLMISSCTSVEGLRDKSITTGTRPQAIQGAIAVLPIRENPEMAYLSSRIELYMPMLLRENLGKTTIFDSGTVVRRLSAANLVTSFSQWKTNYDATGLIDQETSIMLSNGVSARYFLIVHGAHITRERVRAVDTGYSGWVKNADHVWRTDCKISAELIDMVNGKRVWKGVGWAENVDSVRRDIHMGLIIYHPETVPDLEQYITPLIKTAINGIANQLRQSQLRQ